MASVVCFAPRARVAVPLLLALAFGCGDDGGDSGVGGTSGDGTLGAGDAAAGTTGTGGTGGSAGAGGTTGLGGTTGVGGTTGATTGGGTTPGQGGTTGGDVGSAAGDAGAGGSTGGSIDGDAGTETTADAGGQNAEPLPNFSFFVTSYQAIRTLSGSDDGFGGDLRYGETGPGAGLRGADKICTEIAELSMPGSGAKEWHAFLSASDDGAGGGPVHARDRIGSGPWYDRVGRLVGNSLDDLLGGDRPGAAHAAIVDDLPNEDGVPNHAPDGTNKLDNHDTLTGSDETGEYLVGSNTCDDWTSTTAVGTGGRRGGSGPRIGHTWPRNASSGRHWVSEHTAGGCGAGVNQEDFPPSDGTATVGSGGGYGGFYCFALTP